MFLSDPAVLDLCSTEQNTQHFLFRISKIIFYTAFPQFAERELAPQPEKQVHHYKLDKEVKKELKTCLLKETVNDSLERFYCLIKIRDLVHRGETSFFFSFKVPDLCKRRNMQQRFRDAKGVQTFLSKNE